jgi:hypothetical protein
MNTNPDILLVEDSQNDIISPFMPYKRTDWRTAYLSSETAKKPWTFFSVAALSPTEVSTIPPN